MIRFLYLFYTLGHGVGLVHVVCALFLGWSGSPYGQINIKEYTLTTTLRRRGGLRCMILEI